MEFLNQILNFFQESSAFLILFVAVIYSCIGLGNALKGNWGLAIMWFSYALANVGLYITEVGIDKVT